MVIGKDACEIGFIHGRFQIFHNEHLIYALNAKERCKRLIIGITSPDPSTSPYEIVDPHRSEVTSNPCTYFERSEMIDQALVESGVLRKEYIIVPLPIGQPNLIKYYIPNNAVSFFTIYDKWGEEKLRRILDLGYKCQIMWQNRPKGISSSQIRYMIQHGDKWTEYVPKTVAKYIIQHEIDRRIINSYTL